MASNSQDTYIDALHLFNRAQQQLLQAICDDACEADLRAHLDSTLLKITDGANEEQGDFAKFFAELSGEEREKGEVMLARGRVYEKALGEARHNTPIKQFLVMELEKDANLIDYLSLNSPKVRRLKIACWAATCNFVHMVMALIHCRDEGDRGFLYRVLTIAVELGYVELVKRLTELGEFDVNRGRRIVDFDDIHLSEVGEHTQRPVYESGRLPFYAFSDRLTPLNLAAKLGNLEMVNTFLACNKGGALSLEGYWALRWAAIMGHAEVVNAILLNKDVNAAVLMSVEKSLIEHRLSNGFDTSFDWSDGSNIGPFYKVSLTPLQLALLYGHISVVELLKERQEATIDYDIGVKALQNATEMRRDEIVKILMDIPEVEKDVQRMYRERQSLIDAANTSLVVAALIASVTFASGLQPPLGYSPYFGSANLDVGAPIPPGMYPSFASVEWHPLMPSFCAFNALTFVFAVGALVTGAGAARPPKTRKYIGVVLPSLRKFLDWAYSFLSLSVLFAMLTFAIAGAMVFPSIRIYRIIYISVYGISVTFFFIIFGILRIPK